MNDEELHRLLRQHPASLPLPSAFEREVWSRIEADEVRSVPSILAELVRRLLIISRPPCGGFCHHRSLWRSRCRNGCGDAQKVSNRRR
jgi:hypothetical protein